MEIYEPDQPKSGIVHVNGFKVPYQIVGEESSADLEIKIPVSKVLDKSVVEEGMSDVLKSKRWFFRENLEGKELIERFEIVLDDNVHVDVFSFNAEFKQEHIEEIARALSLLYGSLKDKSLWTLKDIILEKENVFNRKTGGNKNGEECISVGYMKIFPITLRDGKYRDKFNSSWLFGLTLHEAAHVVLQNPLQARWDTFKDQLGWEDVEPPYVIEYYDGHVTNKFNRDYATLPSDYAALTIEDDIVESVIAYLIDFNNLDQVRKSLIEKFVDNTNKQGKYLCIKHETQLPEIQPLKVKILEVPDYGKFKVTRITPGKSVTTVSLEEYREIRKNMK